MAFLATFGVGYLLGSSGGGGDYNSINAINEVENNFLNTSNNVCMSQINNEVSDNVLTVDCSGRNCNIDAMTIQATNDAVCSINQQLNQSVENILINNSDMEVETVSDIFGFGIDFSKEQNIVNVEQSAFNNLVNLINNTCNSTVTNVIKKNNVVIRSSASEENNIRAYNIDSDNSAVCMVTNAVNQEAFTKMQSDAKLVAKEKGMFEGLATILIIGGIILFVVLLIIFGGGALFYFKSNKTDGGGQYPAGAQDGGYSDFTQQTGSSTGGQSVDLNQMLQLAQAAGYVT